MDNNQKRDIILYFVPRGYKESWCLVFQKVQLNQEYNCYKVFWLNILEDFASFNFYWQNSGDIQDYDHNFTILKVKQSPLLQSAKNRVFHKPLQLFKNIYKYFLL